MLYFSYILRPEKTPALTWFRTLATASANLFITSEPSALHEG